MSTLTLLMMDIEDANELGMDIISIEVEEAERIVAEFNQQDARIAELTAEVARLRVAVTQGYEEGFKAGIQYQAAEDDTGLDYWTAWNKSIARNALREG